MKYTVRPLTDRAWIAAKPRVPSRFTSTWTDTLTLLEREVNALQTPGMDDPVLMVDAQESDFRLDGRLRARAKLGTSAVALSFDSVNGPMMFRCDRYDSTPWMNRMEVWQHNVRAIALTLEALRSVDRYGATQSGEQYAGWRQIGSEAHAVPDMTETEAAWQTLCHAARTDRSAGFRKVSQIARRRTHPDLNGGDHARWADVQNAIQILEGAGLT